jgi:hypothetical protein
LRDTEVQQPKVTAHLSCETSWRAFSANSGQFDAGSTTTASSGRPITPPFALISSKVISAVFLSAVSEIAIVPDRECSTPTLIGVLSCAKTRFEAVRPGSVTAAPAAAALMKSRRWVIGVLCGCSGVRVGSERRDASALGTDRSQQPCHRARGHGAPARCARRTARTRFVRIR